MLDTIKVFKNVYVIKDDYNNCSNLVIGKERALLFDTGLGIDDLKSEVRKLTDLPLLIINSHGHFDHVGGNFQFDQVFINPKDKAIFNNYNKKLLEDWLKDITGNNITLNEPYDPQFNTLDLDFNEFDLGDLKCFIYNLPGHTRGSIGIYIPTLKLLLSGDALLPVLTLNFDNHAKLEDALKTLEQVKSLEFDYYLTGHSEKAYPKSVVDKLIQCLNNSKTKKHYYYKYPGPPYSSGYFYVDSLEEEPIGVIVAENPNKTK